MSRNHLYFLNSKLFPSFVHLFIRSFPCYSLEILHKLDKLALSIVDRIVFSLVLALLFLFPWHLLREVRLYFFVPREKLELVAFWWLVRGIKFLNLIPVWLFLSISLGRAGASAMGAAATNEMQQPEGLEFCTRREVKTASIDQARTLLYLLMLEWDPDARGGQLICRHRLAKLQTPSGSTVSSMMSRTSGL